MFPIRSVLFAASCALLVTAGCEESVNPFVGSEYPYTIWGFMNAGADTQYVRVYAISDELPLNARTSIDASVFSVDMTTGERREWTYETVYFDSANSGHVFWSPFRATHEHAYRLEVVRSDGATTTARARVPPKTDFQVDVYQETTQIPVTIDGDIPNLVGPKVTYDVINIPPSPLLELEPIHPPVRHPVTVSYERALKRTDSGWTLLIDLIQDTAVVRAEYEGNCLTTPSVPNIWLHAIEFSVVVADSAWNPPGGTFDPNQLVVPGTMSNVNNGYGFFGAGEGVRFTWAPSVETRLRAGYRFTPECTTGPFPDRCPTGEAVPPIPCMGENVEDVWRLWLR